MFFKLNFSLIRQLKINNYNVMKNLKKILIAIVAIVSVAAVSAPDANAQFRFGVKAGLNIDKLSISKEAKDQIVSPDNRTGWRAGVTTEFTVPIIGIGLDASLMFVHKGAEFFNKETNKDEVIKNDYLELPINLKYKFNLPVVSSFLTPFLTTGPSFAFALNKEEINNIKNKNFDVAWNVGVGLELIKHLQVAAGYSWGINKTVEKKLGTSTTNVGRINGWTVTAAYLF